MLRSLEPELMDDPAMPAEDVDRFYSELARLNRVLGNNQNIIQMLRRDPPSSVLDIGCGQGALAAEINHTMGIPATGVDLRPFPGILAADATKDPLPACDLALCNLTVHHLHDEQVVDLVRNVGRSCRRFYILDLVRHPLPLALFSVFMRPLVNRIVFLDGQQSIRRAFTADELRALVVRAIAGTRSTFTQWVSPIYAKQVLDITYRA